MDFESVIHGRRSIRAYKPEPVSEQVVREILDQARWTPSWRNTQAWSVWVVMDEALSRLRAEFQAAIADGAPTGLDLRTTTEWPAACSLRTAQLMATRAASLEAAGEPSDPAAALERMANFFGAPCLIVVGFDDCLAEAYASYDIGAFVQSVCLAAHNRGLGTCIAATIVRYPDLLRRLLPGAENTRMVIAVTLGVPDLEAAANTFVRARADLDEFVSWVR